MGDFFRDRYIIPPYEVGLKTGDRTGTQNASRLGQVLQETIGVDARNIDFFLEEQFGYVGRLATDLSDIGRADREGAAEVALRQSGIIRRSSVFGGKSVKHAFELATQAQEQGSAWFRPLGDALNAAAESEPGTRTRDRLNMEASTVARRVVESLGYADIDYALRKADSEHY